MDLTFTSEQDMLRDGARRYFAETEAFASRAQRLAVPDDGSAWRGYAELGWLALAVPEDAGGLGGDIVDILILAEEFGRALAPAPFVASSVLATRLVDGAATGEQRMALLAAVLDGSMRVAPALYEPGRRYDLAPGCRAVAAGDGGYRLSGAKLLVAGGGSADRLLVTAARDDGGIGLFLVDRDAPGVSCRSYRTLDDGEVADVRFDAVALAPDRWLGPVALDAIEDAIDEARLCLCADTLGGLDQAIALTADYLKTRRQFGQPLAAFQALQHGVADMYVAADAMRSSLYAAISAFQSDPAARRRAVSACWIKTFDGARQVAGQAIHLHGGIGFTTEYQVGHYLRRIMVSERSYGDVEQHLARYMAETAGAACSLSRARERVGERA